MKMMKVLALLLAAILMLTACQAKEGENTPTQVPAIVTDAPTDVPTDVPDDVATDVPNAAPVESDPAVYDLTDVPNDTPVEGKAATSEMTDSTDTIPVDATASAQDETGEEDAVEYVTLSGVIKEVNDQYLLITTPDEMDVQVNLSEETLYELDGEGELSVGAFIHVLYNGQMTRSLPAQIHAIKVSCYTFTGVISELNEKYFMLTTADEQVVQVNIKPEQQAVNQITDEKVALADGAKVTVYFNGVMALSLPGQIGADLIVIVPEDVENIAE